MRLTSTQFAPRAMATLLVLAMLASPTLAQRLAAETCRARCDRFGKVIRRACCAKSTQPRLNHHDDKGAADQQSENGSKYCPGCNGRPLIDDARPLNLGIDATPLFIAAIVPAEAHSVDISFAIFHPPRA